MSVHNEFVTFVRGLETVPDTTKCLKLCPVVLGNLGNQTQTVLSLFAMRVLNYNHFETERMTTESWSGHVRGTRCLRTTPRTQTLQLTILDGRSISRLSNFKVSLNYTLITDFLLKECTQCTLVLQAWQAHKRP